MNQAVLIFSHSISPRLQYIVDFFSQYYGHIFGIIYDKEKFRASDLPCKINYSHQRIVEGEIFIFPNELLFEEIVRPVSVECFQTQSSGPSGYKAFFKTT